MQTNVCTVGTVQSPFRILLVPECCVIKLACTVADNLVSFLGHGWIVLQVIESREWTSFLLFRQQVVYEKYFCLSLPSLLHSFLIHLGFGP